MRADETTTGRRPAVSVVLVIASLVFAGAMALVALIAFAKWRTAAVIEVVAVVLTGVVTAALLGRSGRSVRWAVVLVAASLTAVVSYSLIRSYPPSSDELLAATRLVHDGPLKSPRGLHSTGTAKDTGLFCIIPCEQRAEQSDSVADVDETVADIVGRLRKSGYTTRTERAAGPFITFDADPSRTVVVHADRKGLSLEVSVAPADPGSVVASYAE